MINLNLMLFILFILPKLKIKLYNPDYMVIGSDYIDKRVIGSEYVKDLVFFDRIEGYSTTNILTNDREQVI